MSQSFYFHSYRGYQCRISIWKELCLLHWKKRQKLTESEKWECWNTVQKVHRFSALCFVITQTQNPTCPCSCVPSLQCAACKNIDIWRQRIDLYLFLQIFEQVLSELEPLCLAEQDFISKFFKLQQHPAVIPPLAQVSLWSAIWNSCDIKKRIRLAHFTSVVASETGTFV